MKSKIITKADIILAVVLLVIGLASPFVMQKKADSESQVVVSVDGQVLATEKLSEDKSLTIILGQDGKANLVPEASDNECIIAGPADNIINISGGSVFMQYASCSGKDCIKMGRISKEGQIIACLPHKLIITIVSGEDAPDAVLY